MKSLRAWQILIVTILTALNAYTIAQGLSYERIWGIALSVASLVMLGFCIRLFKAMNKAAEEQEDLS